MNIVLTRSELGMWDEKFYIPQTINLDDNLLLCDIVKKILRDYKLPRGHVWVMVDKCGREIFAYYDNRHIFYSDKNMTIAELCKNSRQFKFIDYDKDYFKGTFINIRKYYINSDEEKYADFRKKRLAYRFTNFINEILYKIFIRS